MRRTLLKLLLALAAVALSPIFIAAQGTTTSLNGSVNDANGAVVPGAAVKIKNTTTSAEYRATTSSNGTFSIPALDPDVYTVTISAPGFKQSIINGVKLDAGTPGSVRVELEVGATTETVVVQGGGEIVQTQSANISTTLNVNQIAQLPLQTRNVMDFLTNLPGVNTTGGPRGSTVNGLPQSTLNITIDGLNTQDNFNKTGDGFFSYISPRIDAVEEVTVSTATPGAESAGQGAVQIRITTRSGSNQYHGSLYEYHRNPWLNSNYWFNNRNQTAVHADTGKACNNVAQAFDPVKCHAPRDRVLLNQFGGRIGGPLSIPKLFNGKDRAFFFVNFEEFQQPTQVSRTRVILNQDTQRGIFQYNRTVNGVATVERVDLLALAARNSQTATIDPVVGKLLADIRNSTNNVGGIQAQTNPNLDNFTFANSSSGKRYYPTIRLDFNLSSKHKLESTYNYQSYVTTVDTLNSRDPQFPGFPNHGGQFSNRFAESLALRSTLTPTLVNEARFGFNGGTVLFFPDVIAAQFSGSVANQAGLNLGIGAAGITSATNTTAPSRRNAPVLDFGDTVTWTRGAHSMSFGGQFTQISFWTYDQTLVPSITFGVNSNDPAAAFFNTTNFPGASATNLTDAQNIYAVLTGRVTAITANARIDEKTGEYKYLGPLIQRGRQREIGVFAADAWRMRPNLTLNYGLRWELQQPFTPLNGSYSTADASDVFGVSGAGNLFKPGVQTGRPTQFIQFKQGDKAYNTDYKNFAPSFGFAWSVNAKSGWLKRLAGTGGQTVVRGGYSIAYNRNGIGDFTGVFNTNPGATLSANRNLTVGNLVGGSLGSLPLLLRETSRLGAPVIPAKPAYPFTGQITDSVNIYDPSLKVPYSQSWTFGIQREITRDMVFEVRYVGTRNLRGWTTYNMNEINIVENGFLNEFKLAQANLQANITASRGNTFRYAGPGTGTSPLPIILAYFGGKLDPTVANNYTTAVLGATAAGFFTNTTFVNSLAVNNPGPATFASNLFADAGRRDNAALAGLPANFFIANPGLQGGANFTGNGGYTRYDSMQVELRRRLSHGLLVSGNYVFAKAFSSSRFSLRTPRVNTLGGTLKHAFKVNWVYELPFGKNKTFFGKAGGLLDRLVGGWEFDGIARIQSGNILDFGNVTLVGMTPQELQQEFKLRFDDANKIIYNLPQDIIDNTIRAFSVSATAATGYGSLGAPTGRYIAPANSKNCIQVVGGDCAPQNLYVNGPSFARYDLSVIKKVRIAERINFELRGEFLNAFNNINFFGATCASSSATCGQVTTSYRDVNNTQDPGGRLVQIVARLNF